MVKDAENWSNEEMNEIIRRLDELPEEWKRAYLWFINNFDFIDRIVRQEEKWTEEQEAQFTEYAERAKDYAMWMMIIYKRLLDNEK